ncbi:MAG: hypothetical protein AAGJ81_16125 [Verrucomicrobiota bacterium]
MNRALDTTGSNWPWRLYIAQSVQSGDYFYDSTGGSMYTADFFQEGTGSEGNGFFEGEGIGFRYQAVSDIVLKGSVSVTATGEPGSFQGGVFCYFTLYVFASGDVPGFNLFQEGRGSQTQDFEVTLPAATVPGVVVGLLSGNGETVEASITLKLDDES